MSTKPNQDPKIFGDITDQLLLELGAKGPVKLVVVNGHQELINDKTRLCCAAEPYLNALVVLEERQLVESTVNDQNEFIYALAEKGILTGLLLVHRSSDVSEYSSELETILLELLDSKSLVLSIQKTKRHVHFVGGRSVLCCDERPFLDAMCELERRELVHSANFEYRLTDKGLASVHSLIDANTRKDTSRSKCHWGS